MASEDITLQPSAIAEVVVLVVVAAVAVEEESVVVAVVLVWMDILHRF